MRPDDFLVIAVTNWTDIVAVVLTGKLSAISHSSVLADGSSQACNLVKCQGPTALKLGSHYPYVFYIRAVRTGNENQALK
jgi:hypothetical protein